MTADTELYGIHDFSYLLSKSVINSLMLDNQSPNRLIDQPEIIRQMTGKRAISYPLSEFLVMLPGDVRPNPHTLFEQLSGLLGQIKNAPSMPFQILIPVHLDDHWAALFIKTNASNRDEPEVAYVDSLGGASHTREREQLLNAVKTIFAQPRIAINQTKFQTDGHSCGPIVIETLKTLATPGEVTEQINNGTYANSWLTGERNPQEIRKKHQLLLDGRSGNRR